MGELVALWGIIFIWACRVDQNQSFDTADYSCLGIRDVAP